MENRYAVFLDDAPQTVFVRPVRRPFVHHLGNSVSHGTVDDVRVTGHPADVRRAPEDIVFFHVEDPLIRQVNAGKISAGGMDDALRFSGGAARIKEKKYVLAVHFFRLAPKRRVGHQLMPPVVPAGFHLRAGLVADAL